MAAEERDVIAIDKWFGLRNTVRPEAFELGDMDGATNVDIDDANKVRMRRGFGTPIFGDSYHSLFASGDVLVGVTGSTLHRIFPTTPPARAVLRTGLLGDRLSYDEVGARIYYTDGSITGCIDAGTHRTWGLEPPSAQPVATAVGGGLPAGTYQYAVRYVRRDGQTSGTGLAGSITLFGSGGIYFTSIPVSSDPDVTDKEIFISPANGDMLYRHMVLPAATTAATHDALNTGTIPLDTQFLQPPIAGQVVAAGPGRVYVARGRKLYRTKAFRHELMDLRENYTFPGYISLVAVMDDGVWVGAGTDLFFLAGDTPAKWDFQSKASYGAITGALARGEGEDVAPELKGQPAVLVGTSRGVVACLNGGIMNNLTKDRFSYPTTDRGAATVRNHGGMTQYLMVLEGTEGASNAAP